MRQGRRTPIKSELLIFFAAVAIFGFASGMTDNVMSNFFKDAYEVNSIQRGILELPREAPGILCFFIVALTSALGDVRLAVLAQLLSMVGITVLGLFTPSFGVMALFIFIHSLGSHIFFPLQDSIGLSIVEKHEAGTRMGQYAAIRSAFTMIASILIFFGFRAGLFSFITRIKLPFLIAALGYFGVASLLVILLVKHKVQGQKRVKRFQIVLKKEYTLYYILSVLTGVHRQIMVVFGPWVLIEILGKQADTLALLGILAYLLGIFLLPVIGRLIDKVGTKPILLTEGIAFILVYFVFGFLSNHFETGVLAKAGIPVFIVFALYVFDRLTMQLGMVRATYLRSIVTDPADITPTISTGFSMDHIFAITCAYLGGVVWYQFGSQFVFYGASLLSVLNVIVAVMIKQPKKEKA